MPEPTTPTTTKPLWKLKTTWVGILMVLAGVVQAVFDRDWAAAGDKVLAGLALIAGRDAIRKMQ